AIQPFEPSGGQRRTEGAAHRRRVPAARVELPRRRHADSLCPPASPRASTVGRITEDACVIETACVSSKSSPCARASLASAASGGAAVRLEPTTLQAPTPQPSSAPSTEGASSDVVEASAMPRMSSARRRTPATTSLGRSSNSRRAANSVRRSASVIRPTIPAAPALSWQREVAVGLPDVAVGLSAPDRGDAPAFRVLDLEFLGQPGPDQLLHEQVPVGADRRQLVRLPAHDEVAAAHVRQARLGALQLLERSLERHARDRL